MINWRPFYYFFSSFILALGSYHTHYQVWSKITYPFPKPNVVELCKIQGTLPIQIFLSLKRYTNYIKLVTYNFCLHRYHVRKVHGTNMGPTWVLSVPDGSHVGPMNFAIRVIIDYARISWFRGDRKWKEWKVEVSPYSYGNFSLRIKKQGPLVAQGNRPLF